jgi:hypothetical protein
VADWYYGEVRHLSKDGVVMSETPGFSGPTSVSVNASDGSCWVADPDLRVVVHLAADGSILSATGWADQFDAPWAVSVNPADGSVWVADVGESQVMRLILEYALFSDVPWENWAVDYIHACAHAGVVNGYPDGLYHPEIAVTRDQMAVYIARVLVSPSGDAGIPDPPATPTFLDVPATHWAYKHIEYAASQSVVEGYEDGTYQPGTEVTRDQMAVYVARSMVAPSGEAGLADYVPSDPRNFPDVPDTFWSYKHIEYCVEQGVVQGYDDGLYHPDWVVTRDQMAAYICRAFELAR